MLIATGSVIASVSAAKSPGRPAFHRRGGASQVLSEPRKNSTNEASIFNAGELIVGDPSEVRDILSVWKKGLNESSRFLS